MVVGYNGDPEEFQAIKDGVLDATILQEPYFIGYRSVEILKEILLDGAFYENVEIGVPVKLVTPENIWKLQQIFLKRPEIQHFLSKVSGKQIFRSGIYLRG